MSDSVDRVFVHALNTVKRIPRTGTARPPASERLKLYGLYKQSMEGDVEGVMDRPVGNTPDVFMECEKWDTWYAQRGLSRTEAKRRYISTLIETMHQYASQTAEARELVAELEFVWDQIKSNTASLESSDSGSEALLRSQGLVDFRSPRGSAGESGGGGGGGGGGGAAAASASGRRLSREEYARWRLATSMGEGELAVAAASSRHGGRGRVCEEGSGLRVMSPVSQPSQPGAYAQSRSKGYGDGEVDHDHDHDADEEEEDDEEDEVYAEAQDNLYEEDDDDDAEENDYRPQPHPHEAVEPPDPPSTGRSRRPPPPPTPASWRRRVEQALTTMTAEIAAVREQIEARALAQRRRSGVWAWIRWFLWVCFRQVMVDLAIVGVLWVLMRLRGDRRLEVVLKVGWAEVKSRLARTRLWRRKRIPPGDS
ncbi:hypothetical protein ASPACDRAFT_60037 [Aspergillus aculeatus ATCC 16872]|uniref:ACB domain-containing protein n=1 Tax=Aspergillus aculeatus (strain ATCC 16872 / CBS 172.66 / WB 5094) TaxID=690307 RepID=A0A1L9WVY4_ASPA1|nr:uncharacterized protein ASPACDRAFT_60037 [Aspergillus aculeatus ATCC 16872]OJK00186.1 hypothetical protein ASPACDRAFT_60037 [Aspergillus aculeatus ATCC 16872]